MGRPIERVSIRPGVSLLSVLPHLSYTHWHALGEFVDNALQSFLAHKAALRAIEGRRFALSVDIDVDAELGEIRIRDNAAGIAEAAYTRAFRPAEAPADASGLSEFGMGMKSAAAWLAPRWTVRSSALGESVTREVSFDIQQIVSDAAEELEVVTTPAHPDEHFTEVVLRNVRKVPQRRTLLKIEDHLAGLYCRFLRNGELRLSLNGARLAYDPPPILVAPYWREPDGQACTWRKDVSIELEGGRRAEGWVAIRARGSTTRAGLVLLRRGRVIQGSADSGYRPREVFGSSNSFVYQRLFGEFELINFKVSHTKDAIRWDEAEEEFAQKLKMALSTADLPILDQAINWRSGESQTGTRMPAPIHQQAKPAVAVRVTAPVPQQKRPLRTGRRLQVTSSATWRKLTLNMADATWHVDLALDYGESAAEWIEIASSVRGSSGERQLQVKLAMRHPFSERFLGQDDNRIEGITRLVTGLAIAEAIAQEDGVRFSGRIRTSLNELLWMGLAD